jgi:pantothenate kinase
VDTFGNFICEYIYIDIDIDIIYEWAIVQFANCEFTDHHWFYTQYLPIIPILDDQILMKIL